MVRTAYGMAEVDDPMGAVVVPGRVHVCWVAGVRRGGVLLGTVYLEAGVGLNASNVQALTLLARRLKQYQKEYLVGGDFNLTEEELRDGGMLAMFDAVVVRPSTPTCASSGRVIDFFLVSKGLRACEVSVVPASPVYPHSPVIVKVGATGPRAPFRVAQAPKPFPVLRPVGCCEYDHVGRWKRSRQEMRRLLRPMVDFVDDEVEAGAGCSLGGPVPLGAGPQGSCTASGSCGHPAINCPKFSDARSTQRETTEARPDR